MRRPPLALLAALALLPLGGCALIDQTTFAAAPPPRESLPAASPAARRLAVDPRIPLIVVGPETRRSDYPALLRDAVRAVARRDAAARYDVTAVAGPGQIGAATSEAAAVMRALAEDGVARRRMLLRAAVLPAHPGHEVRVYLR
jgi:type IV pilus biogenesis protein CpaD/CtpE